MRKAIFFLIMSSLSGAIYGTSLWGLSINGLRYSVNDETNEAYVVDCDGEGRKVYYTGDKVIPEEVQYKDYRLSSDTYRVVGIGYDAFSGCSGLTSITIPNSVTSIGSNAFEGCI